MQRAAEVFEGMHDFASFTRDDPKEKSTRVLLENCTVVTHGSLILVRVTASHFLWNMVRQMVGTLVEVGRGSVSSHDVQQWLRSRNDASRQFTASPSGLFLERVYYKGDDRNHPIRPIIEVQ